MQEVMVDIHNEQYLDVVKAMASCHSLTLINGVISGDPLDVKVKNEYYNERVVLDSIYE